ncbi:MAG: hypothetical protein WA790_19645 [Sulfitobacter sp.]
MGLVILGLLISAISYFDLEAVPDFLARKISAALTAVLQRIFASGGWLSKLVTVGFGYTILISILSEAVYGYDIITVLFEGGYSFAESFVQKVLLTVFYIFFDGAIVALLVVCVLLTIWLVMVPISILMKLLSAPPKGFVATFGLALAALGVATQIL